MSRIKDLIANANEDGTINVKLHVGDLTALLDILDFTYTTSRFLSMQELDKGTANSAIKMQRLSRDAQALHDIVTKTLEIGEPQSTDIN